MKNLFEDVPVEEDTKIISSATVSVGNYHALYQQWYWDGILAESLIFLTKEVKALTEDKLIELVRNLELVKDKQATITYKCSDEFTFVNFNFTIESSDDE